VTRPKREKDAILRTWLMAPPRPHTIRVQTSDDNERTVAVGQSNFRGLARTILALGPTLLEALDKDGTLLRASALEDLLTEAELDQLEPEPPTPAPAPAPVSATPNLGELVGDDAESRRFALFAHLLSDAYKGAHESTQKAHENAFARLAEFTQLQSERASSAERALDTFVRAEQLRLEVARAELDARIAAQRDEEEEDERDEKSPFNQAVTKIANHVAQAVGADGEEDDDEDEPEQHAAPNGAGGH